MILFLSANNSFLPRQKEARHTVHMNGSTPGSHSDEEAEVWPVWQISHQELDPLENSVCDLMFTWAVDCVPGVTIGPVPSSIQGVFPLLSEFCCPQLAVSLSWGTVC